MLNHMRELQKRFVPVHDHAGELAQIERIFNELKPKLECGGARLRCLLDVEKKLRKETAEEHFAAGFLLGWEIRAELPEFSPRMMERSPVLPYRKGRMTNGKTQTIR